MTRSISSETLKEIFGAKSRIYSSTFNKLNTFWMAVKEEKDVKQKYVSLKKCLKIVYGKIREDLFLTYTYLALIVKLVTYLRFENFSSIAIANFTENDFDERMVSVILSEMRKAGWLEMRLDPEDARRRLSKLKSPEEVVKEIAKGVEK